MTITVIPILLGSGIRLFGELDQDIDLKLLQTHKFASGLVTLRYAVTT